MMKNITMNDVLDFIRKSMEKGYNLYVTNGTCDNYKKIEVRRYMSNSKTNVISFILDDRGLLVCTIHGQFEIQDISKKEESQFNILFEDCIEYIKETAIKEFNYFFN